MKTQNTVQLIGYLGGDPVTHTTAKGSKLARFRIATDYYRRDQQGKAHKKTTWHDIIAWDNLAERVPEYFIKGTHALVQGEIQYRTYVDAKGHTRYITEVRATQLLNLDR